MIGSTRAVRGFARTLPTDLRKLLFVHRRRTSAKVLHRDGTGLCIYNKRLCQGRFARLWADTLGQTIQQLACCWMHARRPLHQADKSVPEVGHPLDRIGKLFAVGARARDAADGDAAALLEHRRRLRDTESRDIIAELELWRDAPRPLPGTKHAKGSAS